jgi:ABC-type multidrug transport system ATPase subunit
VTAPPAIAVRDLHYTVHNRDIISGVSFSIATGDIFTILSSSGGGKTTLLRICAGLLEPVSGTVEIEGHDLLDYRKTHRFRTSVRFLFEEGVLLANATIFENVTLPLSYHTQLDEEAIGDKVIEELKALQIDRYKDELPSGVNRSVRKRAHFAMSLAMDPEILIIDNPLEDFDQEGSHIVIDRLARLNEERRVTLLIASHTLDLISGITNRIGIMEGGKMVQSGALEKIVDMLKSMDDHKLGFIDSEPIA